MPELVIDQPTNKLANELESVEVQRHEADERLARLQEELSDPANLSIVKNLATAIRTVEEQRKKLTEQGERLRCRAVENPAEDLAQLNDVIRCYIAAHDEGNIGEFRLLLRNKIRQLISEIWCLVESNSRHHRRMTAQVFFRNGGSRFIHVEYGRGEECTFGSDLLSDADGMMGLKNWRELH